MNINGKPVLDHIRRLLKLVSLSWYNFDYSFEFLLRIFNLYQFRFVRVFAYFVKDVPL